MGLKNGGFGDTPEADFANDAATDKNFREFTKWSDLEMYIAFNGACTEAIKAAKVLFRKWEQSEKAKSLT